MSGAVHIGTSGWNYKHWVGPFYPKDLPQKKMLAYYADHFDTVEVNNTFYQLPQFSTFTTWRETVPPDFTFALKASRFITHMKKLKAPKTSTEKFFNRSERLKTNWGRSCFSCHQVGNAIVIGWQSFLMRYRPRADTLSNFGIKAGCRRKYTSCSGSITSLSAYMILAAKNRPGKSLQILHTFACMAPLWR